MLNRMLCHPPQLFPTPPPLPSLSLLLPPFLTQIKEDKKEENEFEKEEEEEEEPYFKDSPQF